jgi:hypothetical protein
MASRVQIDRLSQRIEALAPRTIRPFVAIRVGLDETEDEARERHYRERPQDRGALETVLIKRVIVDPAASGDTP